MKPVKNSLKLTAFDHQTITSEIQLPKNAEKSVRQQLEPKEEV